MASKVAEAIKRERERREVSDRLGNLEAKVERLIQLFESGAAQVAPAKRARKTKVQEVQTS